MNNTDAYTIFEADQVLTNDHLNELFDYLDIQERLTRNKLIGIGIVCGLEINNRPASINISKGCAVTSKGYLVVWEDADLTQYIPYTLPANPLYKPFINEGTGKQYSLWRLLSDEDANAVEADKLPILKPDGFLKDKIVVLFLEANEIDLKNCDTQNCNEKGRQMELTVRPLLIVRADMEEIISKQKKLSGEDGLSNSYIERLGLKEIALKRFDVSATPLSDAFDIYDAYLKCMDDATLQNIADAYSQCYTIFKPILNNYTGNNPFKTLQADLKTKLDTIKKSLPIYIQYYYDFLDDLVKAYQEFKDKSFDVITECCPDEDQFPMHLMLGEATVDTQDYIRSPFRQYFISSPLFNNQADLLNEVKTLFDRMVNLVKNFFIPQFNLRQTVPIRITPSKWNSAALSARSIPYYYNINNVVRSWNWLKTTKGKSNFNLSYNADKYLPAPADNIVNPMLYSIDQYDFYRIEGHLGQDFSTALNIILSARNSNRLPFDVIALKAGTDATNTPVKYDCHFEDLEAQFKLLRAELACKMHEPLCIAAKVPSGLRLMNIPIDKAFNFLETFSSVHSLALQDVVTQKDLIITKFVQTFRFSKKGDFLNTYCPVVAGTLGNEYMQATNKFFPRPAQIDLTSTFGARAALLHLIDITETLMQTITGAATIYNFNYTNFNRIYDDMISYFTDFMQAVLAADGLERKLSPFLYGMLEAVVTCCIDEKLNAFTAEYIKRVEKIQKQNLLSEYLINNPGIDHKAGVPRGGTFILVYHEAPPSRATLTAAGNTIKALSGSAIKTTATTTKKLAETTAISKDNLSKILKLFDNNELELTSAQASTLKDLTLKNFGAASIKDPFFIADKVVVADFYLPYICCSDCPPVTYVFQKQQQIFSITPTIFCSDDEKPYVLKADPTIDDINNIENKNGLKLDKDASGKISFTPSNQAIQQTTDYTLIYNGISVSIKIVSIFQIEFKPEPIATDPLSRKFTASNIDNKKLEWNFGDGSPVSTDASPVHTYQVQDNEQSFLVTLTVTDGPCKVTSQQSVIITRPQTVSFDIVPKVFCVRDDSSKTFTAQPVPKEVTDIKNPDNLILDKDAAGNIFFVPAKQDIGQTKDFKLSYQDIPVNIKIVVPDAGFTMNLEHNQSPVAVFPILLTLKAKQTDADGYRWKIITQSGAGFDFDKPEVLIDYSKLGIGAGSQLTILLSTNNNKQTGVNCREEKEYVLTEAIFGKHLNNGPFDNLTSA